MGPTAEAEARDAGGSGEHPHSSKKLRLCKGMPVPPLGQPPGSRPQSRDPFLGHGAIHGFRLSVWGRTGARWLASACPHEGWHAWQVSHYARQAGSPLGGGDPGNEHTVRAETDTPAGMAVCPLTGKPFRLIPTPAAASARIQRPGRQSPLPAWANRNRQTRTWPHRQRSAQRRPADSAH